MKIKHLQHFVVLIVCSVLLFACEQQSLFTLIPQIKFGAKENNGVQYIASGIPVVFKITSHSQSSNVNEILVHSYDEIHGRKQLFDTTFASQSKASFEWEYTFPYYQDTTFVQLSFTAKTVDAETVEYIIPCMITPTEKYDFQVVELVDLYSASSHRHSTFGWVMKTSFADSLRTDSVYIYDLPQTDSVKVDKLSYSWGASKGVQFSRVGDFDYGNASFGTIQTVYDYSMHHTTITDIRVGDIFVIGLYEKAFGLIKIVHISDEEGIENDKYTFSAKFIP